MQHSKMWCSFEQVLEWYIVVTVLRSRAEILYTHVARCLPCATHPAFSTCLLVFQRWTLTRGCGGSACLALYT